MALTAGLVVLLLACLGGTSYAVLRHFNDNIHQYDLTGLLGKQPANQDPDTQNILLMGSGTPLNEGYQNGPRLTTDQAHTLMVLHVPANRKWAEVMSIPSNSWVHIPSCEMGNGQMSAAVQGPIEQAFAIGNRYGDKTKLGVACLVKTVEQDTGIYISHFIVVNFRGLHSMVAALSGIRVCVSRTFTDPVSGIRFSAGCHLLSADQVVAYVKAGYGINTSNDGQLIGHEQALASELIRRAKSELYNPLAIYQFVDAVTKSLTIDKKLGGITGLYNLAEQLHSIPTGRVRFFTVPYYPRSLVVPSDTSDVLWQEPEASEIFDSIRDNNPVSGKLLHMIKAREGWGF